jgi:DNA-directed RNA polymerase subunit RPC12/RpoP
MQFQCDRCGKRYSTSQEIREGRAYRFTCRACGYAVIVRGPAGAPAAGPASGRNGNGVSRRSPSSAALPAAGGLAAEAAPPPVTTSVVNPHDAGPPEGGYVEFTLEDQAVTSQSTITGRLRAKPPPEDAAPVPDPVPAPAPRAGPAFARAAPETGGLPQSTRRTLILAAAVVIPAAVGAAVAFAVAGSGKRAEGSAAAPSAPGLLNPVVYVGPIAFEPRASEPDLPAPAPAPRQATRPAPPPPRRTASRESRPSRAAPERTERTDRAERPREPAPPPPAAAPVAVQPPQPQPQLAAASPAPAAAPPPPAQPVEEEAPAFARSGFRRPAAETPGCVEGGIRIPRELGDRLPRTVTLRFAVGRDGGADLVQVLGEGVDPRLGEALRTAVLRCRFVPGTDETGRPTRLWVVMPLRFAQ